MSEPESGVAQLAASEDQAIRDAKELAFGGEEFEPIPPDDSGILLEEDDIPSGSYRMRHAYDLKAGTPVHVAEVFVNIRHGSTTEGDHRLLVWWDSDDDDDSEEYHFDDGGVLVDSVEEANDTDKVDRRRMRIIQALNAILADVF